MKLETLAQDIMDLYYQDYKSEEQFFDIDYFVRQACYAHDKLLLDLYEQRRQEARAEHNAQNAMVDMDPAWLQAEDFDLTAQTTELKLKHRLMAFPFDVSGAAVQDIVPLTFDCVLARTNVSELYIQHYSGEQNVTWWFILNSDTIGLRRKCGKGKVRVYYAPQATADMEVPDGFAPAIQQQVYQIMATARTGTVVDQTNDGNKNTDPKTEANPDQLT